MIPAFLQPKGINTNIEKVLSLERLQKIHTYSSLQPFKQDYVVCVKFIYKWPDLQFKDYQIFQVLLNTFYKYQYARLECLRYIQFLCYSLQFLHFQK